MAFCWLVTGAQGFVGRYVVDAILRLDPAVCIVGVGRSDYLPGCFSHSITGPRGRLRAPLPADLLNALHNPRFSYRQADISCPQQMLPLLQEFRPTVILHLASGLRDDARQNLFEINVEGTARLFEAVSQLRSDLPTIVLGSSGGVYGQVSDARLPIAETACCNPVDEYTISKFAGELLARLLARRFGIPLRIARIFNVIGPGQDERHLGGQLALDLMRIRAGKLKHLTLGPLTSTRDFIDVRDVALALVAVAAPGVPDAIYNVGTGVERSVNELLDEFYGASGLRPPLDCDPSKTSEVSRHFADTARLAGLGFHCQFPLSATVRSSWNYYESVWEGCDP